MEPRFAELLVKGGIVTREQLAEAQKKERENNSSVTKEVVRLGFTSEEALTEFLAKQFGIETVEANFTPYDLYTAAEAFLASTSPTIVPVRTVNGASIGQAAPGPMTLRLIAAWNKMVGIDIVDQALNHLEKNECDRLMALWQNKKAA